MPELQKIRWRCFLKDIFYIKNKLEMIHTDDLTDKCIEMMGIKL